MLKKTGVYTAKCPECGRSVLMHLKHDGSISPNKCSECELEFEGIDNGEERNTFVIIVEKKQPKSVVDEVDEKSEKIEEIKKTNKKSGKKKSKNKNAQKPYSSW